MAAAKGTDLPDLLKHLGYSVRRVGSRYHTTREMDSIRIKDRRTWKRYSNSTGGDAISSSQSPLYSVSAYGENCVRSLASPLPTKSSILRGPQRQEFGGKDFREAVNYLLEFNGCRTRDSPAPRPQPVQTKEKPAFALPIAHADQRRGFAYLQKRGIAPQVIRGFIEAGLLYEDSLHHNCVFVGRDSSGKPVFASKRGTCDLNGPGFKGDAAGSDKNVAFRLPCDPALDHVAVFEAPVDLMSFCTLHRQVRSNAIALCGLYQGPLDTYLRENPHLKRIILCLDADAPGREAAEKLQEEYEQKGYTVSVRLPAPGKDWNELLQNQVLGRDIPAPKSKRSQLKKEERESVADLEKLISDKTIADAQRREQQQADQGFAVSIRDESVDRIAADPELFARYLNMQGDNPAYSAGNIAMVMHQNPEATVVFTRDRWKDRGRFVLEAEQDKGCKIFVRSAPRRDYILTDTFDVAQTQGRDIWRPHLEDNTQEMETALATLLNYSPVPVIAQEGLDGGAYYDPQDVVLAVDPGCSDSEAFGAIAAEIAQARYHDRGFNWGYSRESCELSAQSVAYTLCRRFGISRELPDLSRMQDMFVGRYGRGKLEVLNNIRSMSRQIGSGIQKSLAPPQRAAPSVNREAR